MLIRGLLQKLGLIAAGIIIALVVSEGLIRGLKLAESIDLDITNPSSQFMLDDDPILKYRRKNPFQFGKYFYDTAKAPKTYRIVIVGDSVTFGSCRGDGAIEPKKTYPALLEELLNAGRKKASPKFEVANLSVPGYNTISEAQYLRNYGLSLKPDLVVVAYSVNDYCVGNPLILRKLRKEQNPSFFDQWGPALYRNSNLVRFLWNAIKNEEKDVCSWEIPQKGFENIRAMSSQYGFKTLAAVIPSFLYDNEYPADPGYKKVAGLAKDSGFAVANLYDYLKPESFNLLDLQGRCTRDHPDEQGHIAIAKAMNKYLIDSHLITAH
jgi:hypothetical protein